MSGIKIVTLNIRHGRDHLENEALSNQADLIKSYDIALIQETERNTARNPDRDLLEELSKLTGLNERAYGLWHPYKGGNYGVGILSRFPITVSETLLLPVVGVGETSDIDSKVRKIPEQRGILICTVATPQGVLRVVNTHSSLWRNERLVSDLVLYSLAKYSELPIIVGGDLNIEYGDEYPNLHKLLELSSDGYLTYPATSPEKSIDKFFGLGVNLIESHILTQVVSDHLGVGLTISLQAHTV